MTLSPLVPFCGWIHRSPLVSTHKRASNADLWYFRFVVLNKRRILYILPLISRHCNIEHAYPCVMTSHTPLWHRKHLLRNRLLRNRLRTQLTSIEYGIPMPWWRHQMETFFALLVLCARNSPATGEFPAQKPVTLSFDVFFDQRLNKRLSKQSSC